MAEVPEGFVPLSNSGFTALAGPFYSKEVDDGIVIGLLLEDRHCNSAGTAHGGFISTMADIALGASVANASLSRDELERWRTDGQLPKHVPARLVAVTLSTDFTGSAKAGEWVEMRVDVQRSGRTLSFANAYLHCNGKRVARSSGIYRGLG